MFLRGFPRFLFLRNHHSRKPRIDDAKSLKLFKTVEKRSALLHKLMQDRDKRKLWHFELNTDTTVKTRNVFHKIHQPSRRMNVLNSLFMRNITDVLSTQDIIPEISDQGIQITNVKISKDLTILNVYWQVPEPSMSRIAELRTKLAIGSPKIRSELINRNVLGKVPRIYFKYDQDGEHSVSYIENSVAVESLLEDSIDEGPVVPIEDVAENVLKFTESKKTRSRHEKENVTEENTKADPKATLQMPVIPQDMKTDVFGLEHEKIMRKILTSKTQNSSPSLNVPEYNFVSLTSSNDVQKNHSQEVNTSRILKKFCAMRQAERIEVLKCYKSQKLEFVKSNEHMADDFEPVNFDEEPYCKYSDDVMYGDHEDDKF